MRSSIILVVLLMQSACANPTKDIQSADYLTRVKASQQFAQTASSVEIQQLILLLGSAQDIDVRASCADALGYAKATNAVLALIKALDIPEWRMRRSVANALGRIADPRAIDPLIKVLREEPTDPNLSEGRRCAVYAFVNLKSEKVVPVLIHMLTHNPGKDESERIDYTGALMAALGAQKDTSAIPVLAEFLDGRHGGIAAGAIGKIVGVDFRDEGDPFRLPSPSPTKAKAWIQKHPELLTQTDDKPDAGNGN